MKNEPLPVTYSYWDGTGHRRKVVVRKGDTIAQFLKAVKLQLAEEFRELRWDICTTKAWCLLMLATHVSVMQVV